MGQAMRMRGLLRNAAERAFESCDAASLVFFRISFGVILLWEVVRYFRIGWIDSVFLAPRFHFTYWGFGWMRPLPEEWLSLHFLLLGVAAALLTLGWWYRAAAASLCVGWTYVLLMEKTAYLNHLYLICLLSFLLIFVPAHRAFSLDSLRRKSTRTEAVPAIALWVLRTQIAIPYVYGAIAKLNGDWLHGSPLQMWMSRMTHVRAIVPAFGETWLALAFSDGGFLLDLLVVPLLLWRRTRAWAFAVAVVFHLLNSVMFRIGIFPWFMICATTLFFDPDWPRRVWPRLRSGHSQNNPKHQRGTMPSSGLEPSLTLRVTEQMRLSATTRSLLLVGIWFLIQCILPFRHLLYPGNVDWTEEGSQFAWRMMLSDKTEALRILAVDRKTRQVTAVDPRKYLTSWQLEKFGHDPDLLVQFAHFVAEDFRRSQDKDVEVHAQVFCSLNGRKPQLLVDPQVDLANQTRSLWPQPWIVPLYEPLPDKPWDEPPSKWEMLLDFSNPATLKQTQSETQR